MQGHLVIIKPTFPYFYKKRYFNYVSEKAHGFFIVSLCMFFYSRLKRLQARKPTLAAWVTSYKEPTFSKIPHITWLGHSTFLIQCGAIKILTDPIFGNASFLFKRILPLPLDLQNLSNIDYILLSHNHRDHMDKKSLYALKKYNPTILVPYGDKAWFDRHNFCNVYEHTWWQTTHLNNNEESLMFTFLPAQHWSQRSLFDRNRSLWGSWMIQYKNFTIYFAGDTAYASHFKMIQKKFSNINVALMPIGPCQPSQWLEHSHINACQAGQAFLDLYADHFIPMHWGTFYFGIDSFSTPIEYLIDWWNNEQSVSTEQLHILKCGQTWAIEEKASQLKSIQIYEKQML